METIAIMSLKGGTGKSLTAYAMSCILAARGYKVLAVDADWEGALSRMAGVDPETSKVSIPGMLSEEAECLHESLIVTKKKFSLIPSCSGFYKDREMYGGTVLRDALSHFQDFFDYCIIDAPPYADAWGESILTASQKIIIPEHMGVLGFGFLEVLKGIITKVKLKGNPGITVAGILFTEAGVNSKRRERLDYAAMQFGTKVFTTEIRYDEKLDMARVERMADILSRSYVFGDYKAFVDELLSPV